MQDAYDVDAAVNNLKEKDVRTHWVFAALIAGNFPWFAGRFGQAPSFAFFAVMMVFQLLFVWKMMPETKGVSLEDLEKKMVKEEAGNGEVKKAMA